MITTTTPTLQQQIKAAFRTLQAVAEAIKELGQVASGNLYQQCMGLMDLETFNRVIDQLVSAELVRREPSHLLVWIGPK